MATQSLAKTAELTSEVLAKSNPFEVIKRYSPAQTKTAVLVELTQMMGESFKEFFKNQEPWLMELKINRFKVRPGSKGEQLEVKLPGVSVPVALYWHEYFERTFRRTERYFRQLVDTVEEGMWKEPPMPKEGERVRIEVDGTDTEACVVRVDETAKKVDVQPLAKANESLSTAHDVITLPFDDVEKVKPAKVTKVTTGQLLLLADVDGGTEYRYEGGGKIKRTGKPSTSEQRKADEKEDEERREAKKKADAEKKEKAEREKKAEAVRKAEAALKKEEASLEEKNRRVKKGAIPAGLIATNRNRQEAPKTTEKSAHGFFANWDKRKAMKGHAPWCVVNEKDEKTVLETCYTEQDALNSVKQREDGTVAKEAAAAVNA